MLNIDIVGVKMKKKSFILLLISFFITLNLNVKGASASEVKYFLGGIPVGIELTTRGATVVGTCEVVTNEGVVSPSKKAGITAGDVILSIDSIEVNDAFDVELSLKNGNDKCLMLDRRGEIVNVSVKPAKDLSGNYKLGIFIKNGVSGIGTITYFSSNGRFASLGHPVFLNDKIAEIKKGNLYSCQITSYISGEYCKPGELKGVFIKDKIIGVIDKNAENGVFGNMNRGFECYPKREIQIGEGKIGEACIYTTINGNVPKEYSISIVKTDYRENNVKNFVIKINDKELIEKTGGIVQGMSGSPIVQDGKLIGAVTHVFTNDPLRGFGISIENMIA